MVDQKLNVNKLIYHTLYCWLVYSGTNIVNRDFADLHSLVTNIATFFSSTLCTCVCFCLEETAGIHCSCTSDKTESMLPSGIEIIWANDANGVYILLS